MRICIIIPAYNEEEFLPTTLNSLLSQKVPIESIVIVDDGSKDKTPQICAEYASRYDNVSFVVNYKKEKRASGSKVVRAFNLGLASINLEDFDLISKIDSDMGFEKDYFSKLKEAFQSNPQLGLYGGICLINKNNEWVEEVVSNKDHVRGGLKTFRVEAFKQMNGLREIMGWDSIDEFLLRFYKWEVVCDAALKVKHYRVTHSINGWYKESKLNGEVFKNLGYNFIVAGISSLKRGITKKPFLLTGLVSWLSYIKKSLSPDIIDLSKEQKKFINSYRIENFKKKLR